MHVVQQDKEGLFFVNSFSINDNRNNILSRREREREGKEYKIYIIMKKIC